MHFSIAETEECNDENGNYTLYKIHVNGAHHCSVRFSQLHNLHEQLRSQEFANQLPLFPPKKFFSLSVKEKEERRVQLERFLQQLTQSPVILNSDVFINFFLNAQKETQRETETQVDLTVYLMNSDKITVQIQSYDQTEDLLEKLMEKIQLKQENLFYFGIYLVKRDEQDSIKIVRKLQDFESPFISLKAANKLEKHRLLLRKCIFDLNYEANLFDDEVAINLLYIQAVEELSKGWILPDASVQKQLNQLREKNAQKEFLRILSTQKFYGFMHFKESVCNYPTETSRALICLGNRTLVFRLLNQKRNVSEEISFKVTRIRCWKIIGMNTIDSNNKTISQLEFAFEYLFNKDELKWISIITDQAILLSMSLQTMVDEIVLRKEGKTIKRFTEKRGKVRPLPFLTRQKSIINNDAEQHSQQQAQSYVDRDSENKVFDDNTVITNDDL